MDDGTILTRLLDRVEIEELTARYNRSFDDMDVEAWCATFVEDGTMALNGREWSGRAALARLIQRIGFGMVHVTANPIVHVDGDHATQHCSLLLLRRSPERRPVELLTTGRYVDELVRVDGAWRFRRRDCSVDSDL